MTYTSIAGLAHACGGTNHTSPLSPSPRRHEVARVTIEDEMTSHPALTRSSTLPDYYGDERRALRRVRVRESIRWLSLFAAATLLAWRAGR